MLNFILLVAVRALVYWKFGKAVDDLVMKECSEMNHNERQQIAIIYVFHFWISYLLILFESYAQLESLPAMVAGVSSSDSNLQLEATTQFRKLLSIGSLSTTAFSVYFIR